jgi:hypothetical protein
VAFGGKYATSNNKKPNQNNMHPNPKAKDKGHTKQTATSDADNTIP